MSNKATAKEIVAEARARLRIAQDANSHNVVAAMEDIRFAAGEQWPDEIAMARKLDRRPCLVFNKTDVFCRNVVNNMRQQRPRIQVHPVADGADEAKAKVIQGLVRHIEVNSNADYAYDTGADFQVRGGWGYWRLVTRYVDDKSFDQEIYIDAVKNPFTVYMDPSSVAPDGSDAQWCLITTRMKVADFKKQYPGAKVAGLTKLQGGDDLGQWATKEELIVAEYYRIEMVPDVLLQLTTGARLFRSDYLYKKEAFDRAGITVAMGSDGRPMERDSMRRTVKWSKVTAMDELESSTLPGKYIPVVPVYGAELMDSGKVIRYGMVRHLKDPQRNYNFWKTQETEIVALAPKAPWLMAEGQDEGREDEWNQANTRNVSSLKYKPVMYDDGTTPVPPPIRLQPQALPAASVNAAAGASDDMKAVAGMFDPSLGAEGNETSGTMVQRRQQQSDLSNFHFYDNLTRSIRWTGKLILDWIPTYYDTERVIRILGEDNTPQSVTINQKAVDGVMNDVTTGTYDVVMETGPGYQTKREEAFDWMLAMGQAYPRLFEAAGDLIMRQSDNPGASDIADRLAATMPFAQLDKSLPENIDPKVKTMLMQAMGQVETLKQQLQQLQMEKQAHLFGVQAKESAVTQRTAMQEEHETHRLAMKELGADERTRMEIAARLHETAMKDTTSLRETLIDAHTNLEIAHRQALQRGNPDSNRPSR